ncbi:50S ribosomal protein L24 [Metamycoplasma cloacale]|uniref:Large ribosomal subunit protein uL24 n=1 Tax=Metamycoplasma cloacale TaxID=92401 RepID=A0A2Z4LMQ0_9BACT|nr:50S ribosomal protein L24 [Metamycoplasma cloacale]AWX42708.1 50S ribosomal protein L24 [Metamycoplasma cloacale]VEU79480.1 50S ribosomal protein L24 [Metamycoplasma cloacale]
MAQAKIKKNDMVLILSGNSKGKYGAVIATDVKKQTVTVKDVNIKVKHHKPSQENQQGKIEKKEYPIHVSKVAYLLKKGAQGQPSVGTKIGFKVDAKSNKKQRLMRKVNKTV